MTPFQRTTFKFAIFATVMVLLSGLLFVTFGQYRTGPTTGYSALFNDASEIAAGDSVRVAGVQVGSVQAVSLQPDKTVAVRFDVNRAVLLTTGTKVAVRYLNLVGDRYLALIDSPGTAGMQPAASQIPPERTLPALDLDLLLGGLKPVIKALNPQDVNTLTTSLLRILQGQATTLESMFSQTSSFTNALSDNSQVVQQLIDNLRTLLVTLNKEGGNFTAAVDRIEQLITELSAERDPIGDAIDSLDKGTASLTDLLSDARSPLAGSVEELSRLAPLLDKDKALLERSLQKAPGNYRKLARIASYGSFIQFYLCGVTLRVSDLQGRTAEFPWISQLGGRCAEN